MSASPMARQASIPTRRVVINSEHEMPLEYGTTPGGTMFGTTPGGTRIVYERNFLLHMRQSPLAKSPPPNLPNIPGVTSPEEAKDDKAAADKPDKKNGDAAVNNRAHDPIKEEGGDDQFSMDM